MRVSPKRPFQPFFAISNETKQNRSFRGIVGCISSDVFVCILCCRQCVALIVSLYRVCVHLIASGAHTGVCVQSVVGGAWCM